MKPFYRDRWNKKIAGICGGLGQLLQIDPTVIRLLVTFTCVITAFLPVILGYIIIWILTPLGPMMYVDYTCRRLYRNTRKGKISGVCAGVADFLKIDVMIVRLVALVLLIFTGVLPIVITYFVGMMIIPVQYTNRRQ